MTTALFALIFSIAFAFRNHFQFMERNDWQQPDMQKFLKRMNRNWHIAQAAVQASVIIAIAAYSIWQPVWVDALLFTFIFWVTFETTLNLLNGDGLIHLGGGVIDNFFNQWHFGAAIKFCFQLLLLAITVLLYNWFP